MMMNPSTNQYTPFQVKGFSCTESSSASMSERFVGHATNTHLQLQANLSKEAVDALSKEIYLFKTRMATVSLEKTISCWLSSSNPMDVFRAFDFLDMPILRVSGKDFSRAIIGNCTILNPDLIHEVTCILLKPWPEHLLNKLAERVFRHIINALQDHARNMFAIPLDMDCLTQFFEAHPQFALSVGMETLSTLKDYAEDFISRVESIETSGVKSSSFFKDRLEGYEKQCAQFGQFAAFFNMILEKNTNPNSMIAG